MAGTSPAMTYVMPVLQRPIIDIFRIQFSNSHAGSLSRIARGELLILPLTARGMERREAHLAFVSLPAPRARRWFSESASPCGAPLRRFWARGPYFRVRTGELVIPDPTAFAAFIRTASSRERQSHVVGPDGDPADKLAPSAFIAPPGRNGCEPCVQAPHPAPLHERPREAPLTNRTCQT